MAEGALSTGDLALMRDNDGFGGGNGFFWVFALLILMFGGNGFGFGGGRPGPDVATADQVNQGFMNQNMQQIALSSANNNYETAQLINGLGNSLQQQNNSNMINAIQGFNALGLQITNQTNMINQQLMNLQAKLDTCCCEIKTQMLQNRYEDVRARNVSLENEISNFQQSQYILGQMGRWVGYAPGATTAASGT